MCADVQPQQKHIKTPKACISHQQSHWPAKGFKHDAKTRKKIRSMSAFGIRTYPQLIPTLIMLQWWMNVECQRPAQCQCSMVCMSRQRTELESNTDSKPLISSANKLADRDEIGMKGPFVVAVKSQESSPPTPSIDTSLFSSSLLTEWQPLDHKASASSAKGNQ